MRLFISRDLPIASLGAAASATTEVGCTLTRARTGRTLSYLTAEQSVDDALIQDWLSGSDSEFEGHSAYQKFRAAVQLAPAVTGVVDAFRGRFFSQRYLPTFSDFGPPPLAVSSDQRYSRRDLPALYLGTTVAGIVGELQRKAGGHETLYCQSFRVDGAQLTLGDFAASELPPIVAMAFDYCEHLEDPCYSKSQRLADIIRAMGFHGMVVPGVRGSPENRYSNVVIFEPENRWMDLVCRADSPNFVNLNR